MEKNNILYSVCLNDKNISALIDIICEDIKLSERSIPKCAAMAEDIMKKNISKLSRNPRDREELRKIVKYLNQLCISTIIEIITKKYPDLQINRKKQVSREQLRRNLDVWGDRENRVPDRPYIKSRKEYDDDDKTFYSMKPNDLGISGNDDAFGGFASAFGNHLITNVPAGQKQVFNNPHTQKDPGSFEQRFNQLINDRNYGLHANQKPETPDFTLDGSGDKVRQEKMMRRIEDQQVGMGGMGGMPGGMGGMPGMSGMMGNGMPGNMSGTTGWNDPSGSFQACASPVRGTGGSDNDIYASLLGAGAPSQPMFSQQQTMGGMTGIGLGNPLMPLSSTNMMADQLGMNSMQNYSGNQSAKTMQLQNDLEKKLAERRQTDMETNQPQASTYGNQNTGNMGYLQQGNQYGMPQQMGMGGMNTTGMQMPMQMPMQSMQMPMQSMQMPMQSMQMPMQSMQSMQMQI